MPKIHSVRMGSPLLVCDIVPTANGGQFLGLVALFSDVTNPLYYKMTIAQAVEHHDAITAEHPGLLMELFLSHLLSISPGCIGVHQTRVSALTFGVVVHIAPAQYGLKPEQ
jgi:hypothetical protein